MSTDEYSQELPDEMYLHRASSAASTSYPNIGSSSSCSLPMPGNLDMTMQMVHAAPQDQQQIQRQKRKYTRRKQPEERKKRGPRTKDLNAPRMPLNGYVRFLNANRERIKQENADLSFAEVTKKLASEWSSMSADDKKAYLDEAEKAKEMYLKELAEYQQTDSYQEFISMKQRAKQQQQQPPPTMIPASHHSPQMTASHSQPGAMYPNSQNYYESSQQQSVHPGSQYAQMYQQQQPQQQQQQQSYHYGMNGSGMSTSGHNGAYSQQQYYPSSGHSSVTSDYGNMPGPGQYQARYPSQYVNPTNGMSTNFTSSSVNSIDLNDQMSMQGNSYSGSSSLSATLDKCNASVMDLPIFTEEFLEHNKTREQELRNLRSLTVEYEEENAILSKHVDDMTAATEKLLQDEARERDANEHLKQTFERLQQTLVDKMQYVNLPQMYMQPSYQYQQVPYETEPQFYRPSMENIDHFMAGLDQFQRAQSLANGGDVAGCKSEPLVQSIQTAISVLDEVTYC